MESGEAYMGSSNMGQVSIIHVPPTLNYDPYTFHADTTLTNFQPVHVLLPEGTVLYYFPAKWINHRNSKKRDRLIKRGEDLIRGAEDTCKHVSFDADRFMLIAELIAGSAIRIIYLNVLRIMLEAARREVRSNPALERTGLGVDMEGREIPESRDAAELMAHNILMERMEEKLGPAMMNRVIEADDAYGFVWRHIYFFIAMAIERDHGPIEQMGLQKFAPMWNYYFRTKIARPVPKKFRTILDPRPIREFEVALDQARTLFASNLARDYLEENNPASWSLERLVEFLGYVMVPNSDSYQTISIKKDRANRVIKKLLSMSEFEPELSWDDEDGSLSFQFTFKVEDTSRVDLAEFAEYVKGNKDLRGGAHNVKVGDLPEGIRKALGERYIELKDILSSVKREAKTLALYNSDWGSALMQRYEVLRSHPDLIDRLILQGDVEPWQIYIEIAAREIIPGYLQLKKKPTANTLRATAIIPKEEDEQ
jgi:hypothetical protein